MGSFEKTGPVPSIDLLIGKRIPLRDKHTGVCIPESLTNVLETTTLSFVVLFILYAAGNEASLVS